MRAWCARRRRNTGYGSAPASCYWRQRAWRAERSGVLLAARPGQHRSGACAMAKGGLTVSTKRATGAPSQNTRRKRTNAFWRCWISQSPRVMPAGRDRSWPRHSAMSMCSISGISGASCEPRRSISPAQILVREQRSGVRCQGGRCGRALHGPAGERDRPLRR